MCKYIYNCVCVFPSRVLSYISLQLHTDSEFASWRNYMRNISTPMMQKLRVEELPTDTHLDRCEIPAVYMYMYYDHGQL